jgi:hypothetical protein
LVVTLTILLLPRLQLQTRTLAIGDIAPADIKAHTDFLIEDEVSAQKKRKRPKIVCCHSTILTSKRSRPLTSACSGRCRLSRPPIRFVPRARRDLQRRARFPLHPKTRHASGLSGVSRR